MIQAIQEWKTQLSALPAPERAELAHFLLSSLEPEEDGVVEGWDTEIARRAADIRSGKTVGRPADQVFAELREQYP